MLGNENIQMSTCIKEGDLVTDETIEEMQRLENIERGLKKIFDYGFKCNTNFLVTLNRVQQMWKPEMSKEEREKIGI